MAKKWFILALTILVAAFLAVAFIMEHDIKTTNTAHQPTVITFWHHWNGEEAKSVQNLVNEFNKTHPDIEVKVLPSVDAQKLLTAMTGGTPPDVGYVAPSSVLIKWAKVGAIEPLDSYVKESSLNVKDFPAQLLSSGKYNGNTYAFPLITDTYMLFYNKKLFKEAGISNPPTTFGELQRDAQKLTKQGSNGYTRLGFVPDFPWLDQTLLPFEFGADFYNESKREVTPENTANIAALQFESSFFSNPYNLNQVKKFKSGFGKYASPDDPFFTGELAMVWQGEWWPTYIHDYSPTLDYGIAPMPYPDGHPELKNTVPTSPGMIFIPRGSQHKEAAWTFIQWMLATKQLDELAAGMGGLPTTYTSLNSPLLIKLNPSVKPFAQLLLHGKVVTFPSVSFQSEYLNAMGTEEQKVLDLQETPQQAMEKVKQQIQPLATSSNK